jgi:hypothetical protein
MEVAETTLADTLRMTAVVETRLATLKIEVKTE